MKLILKNKWRIIALALIVCMLIPYGLSTASIWATDGTGLCEHHPHHTDACGYVPGTPAVECSHTHTDSCYEDDLLVCSHRGGCPADGSCGYKPEEPGTECQYECPVCDGADYDQNISIDYGTQRTQTIAEQTTVDLLDSVSAISNSTEQVITTTNTHEYSTDAGKTWIVCENGELALTPGVYQIREQGSEESETIIVAFDGEVSVYSVLDVEKEQEVAVENGQYAVLDPDTKYLVAYVVKNQAGDIIYAEDTEYTFSLATETEPADPETSDPEPEEPEASRFDLSTYTSNMTRLLTTANLAVGGVRYDGGEVDRSKQLNVCLSFSFAGVDTSEKRWMYRLPDDIHVFYQPETALPVGAGSYMVTNNVIYLYWADRTEDDVADIVMEGFWTLPADTAAAAILFGEGHLVNVTFAAQEPGENLKPTDTHTDVPTETDPIEPDPGEDEPEEPEKSEEDSKELENFLHAAQIAVNENLDERALDYLTGLYNALTDLEKRDTRVMELIEKIPGLDVPIITVTNPELPAEVSEFTQIQAEDIGPIYYCGFTEEHEHDESCTDENGNFICEELGHVHDEFCTIDFSSTEPIDPDTIEFPSVKDFGPSHYVIDYGDWDTKDLTQTSNHIQDAISAAQTMEGALSEIHDMLQYMWATNAKSISGETDIENAQISFNQTCCELIRICEHTSFCGWYGLLGSEIDFPHVYSEQLGIYGPENFLSLTTSKDLREEVNLFGWAVNDPDLCTAIEESIKEISYVRAYFGGKQDSFNQLVWFFDNWAENIDHRNLVLNSSAVLTIKDNPYDFSNTYSFPKIDQNNQLIATFCNAVEFDHMCKLFEAYGVTLCDTLERQRELLTKCLNNTLTSQNKDSSVIEFNILQEGTKWIASLINYDGFNPFTSNFSQVTNYLGYNSKTFYNNTGNTITKDSSYILTITDIDFNVNNFFLDEIVFTDESGYEIITSYIEELNQKLRAVAEMRGFLGSYQNLNSHVIMFCRRLFEVPLIGSSVQYIDDKTNSLEYLIRTNGLQETLDEWEARLLYLQETKYVQASNFIEIYEESLTEMADELVSINGRVETLTKQLENADEISKKYLQKELDALQQEINRIQSEINRTTAEKEYLETHVVNKTIDTPENRNRYIWLYNLQQEIDILSILPDILGYIFDTQLVNETQVSLEDFWPSEDIENYEDSITITEPDQIYNYHLRYESHRSPVKNVLIVDELEFLDDTVFAGTLTGVQIRTVPHIEYPSVDLGYPSIIYLSENRILSDPIPVSIYVATKEDLNFEGNDLPEELQLDNQHRWRLINPDTYENWASVYAIAFYFGEEYFGQDYTPDIDIILQMRSTYNGKAKTRSVQMPTNGYQLQNQYTAYQWTADSATPTSVTSTAATVTVTVNNPVELPRTGGSGTTMIYLCGAALVGLGLAVIKRKKELFVTTYLINCNNMKGR